MNANLTTPDKKEMTRSTHRGPFALLDELRSELDNFWQKPWMQDFKPFFRNGRTETTWMPRLDVFKKDNELVVKADLPGLAKQNVKVYLDEGALVIEGERTDTKEIKEEALYQAECMYGSFYRRLPLSFDAAPEKITAKFADGVLEVHLPMPADVKSEPKPIAIN